jgi:tetratricopeptide (TPR) repeat protein
MEAPSSGDRWAPSVTTMTIPPSLPAVIERPETSDLHRRRIRFPRMPVGNGREPVRFTRRSLGLGIAAITFLAIALISASTLRIESTDEDDVAADLSEAFELQSAGQLDEAAVLYREVLVAEPESIVALFNLGVIEDTQGDATQAARYYEDVLAIQPDHVPAMFNLAVLHSDAGEIDEAIRLYRNVLAVDPDHAASLLNLGILLLQQGEAVEASALIDRAIELDPTLAGSTTGS